MPKKITKRKREMQRRKRINLCIEILLTFLVAGVPTIALLLYGLGACIPVMAVGICSSVSYILAGIMLIAFAVLERFGFGEEGVGFSKLGGARWLTKKESKANEGVLGGILILIGLIFAILMIIYC